MKHYFNSNMIIYSVFFFIFFSLDELLDGGLYTGELTEIVGAAGVGKSQVCHNHKFPRSTNIITKNTIATAACMKVT